jgi:hypothetical protein
VSGLEPDTSYDVKAGLRFETGEIEGATVAFTTRPLPAVTTGVIESFDAGSVRAGGEVVSGGGAPIVARGIVVATTPLPDLATGAVHSDGSPGLGTFSILAEGLAPATRHYLRAYATNENGDTGYGEERGFVTDTTLALDPDDIVQLDPRTMVPGEVQRFFLTVEVPRAVIWSPGTTGFGLRLYDGGGDLLEETTGGDLERILLPGTYQVALSNPGGTPVDFTLSVDATQAVTARPLVTVSPSRLVSRKLRKVTATARIGNPGTLPDVLRVGGTRGTRLFKVTYAAGSNVTAQVVAGLLETGTLGEGDAPFLLTAVVSPEKRGLLRKGVILKRTFIMQVRATSATPPGGSHAGQLRVLTR